MKKTFVGGSRKICRLTDVIRQRLDGIMSAAMEVVIGDANGADKAIQDYFHECHYSDVIVYHSGISPRNNIGNWTTKRIEPKSKKKDFFYYTAKDIAMADDADIGFMLWDGVSKGTLNNILNLMERRKKCVVYYSPERRCVTIAAAADLQDLLNLCPESSLEVFRDKIDLDGRMLGGQQKLNLEC
jgi:hypothetical protein